MKFRKLFTAVLLSLTVLIPLPAENAAAFSVSDDISFNEIMAADTDSAKREAGDILRQKMAERADELELEIIPDAVKEKKDVNDIINFALEETGIGTEGDYIRWSLSSYQYEAKTDRYRRKVIIHFSFTYNSSAEQEQIVTEKLSEVYAQLDLNNISDLDKISRIYEYITSNVRYPDVPDENNRTLFSAYGALINREAVCQGYALLLYRMLTDCGLQCRVVPGNTDLENHAWNIVRIGEAFYYLDPTWDTGRSKSNYLFYLRGTSDFDSYSQQNHYTSLWEHEESPVYSPFDSGEFYIDNPVSLTAYSRRKIFRLGDLNADGKIDSSDATIVLSSYASVSVGKLSGLNEGQLFAADTDGDGAVSSADATNILSYYSYQSTGGNKAFDQYLKTR
ncbi:transglutaminase domain-containing protein [Ruminococcus sp. XPD3002]|uniref:transglutaminase domain-containing protein n=1 Tax=Ruminococcus sp. XPD3002 TaxID=1452269 RepID=UPI0009228470|nr:Transglutaminase-like superfamily protein [Ruminococcus flavefaciens]